MAAKKTKGDSKGSERKLEAKLRRKALDKKKHNKKTKKDGHIQVYVMASVVIAILAYLFTLDRGSANSSNPAQNECLSLDLELNGNNQRTYMH